MIGKQQEEVSFPRGSGDVVKPDLAEAAVLPKQGKAGKRKAEKDLFSSKGQGGAVSKGEKKAKKDKSKKIKKSALDISNVSSLTYSQLNEVQSPGRPTLSDYLVNSVPAWLIRMPGCRGDTLVCRG